MHKELDKLINDLDISFFLSFSGHPSWSFLIFKDTQNANLWELKTLFMQEMFKCGIFTLGAQTLSYAHKKSDIDYLLNSYRSVFSIIKESIENNSIQSKLECKTLQPLFSVR